MFAQIGVNGDGKGGGKKKEQRSRRNMDHVTCNNCGEKGHCSGNSKCSTHTNLTDFVDAFRKMKQ